MMRFLQIFIYDIKDKKYKPTARMKTIINSLIANDDETDDAEG